MNPHSVMQQILRTHCAQKAKAHNLLSPVYKSGHVVTQDTSHSDPPQFPRDFTVTRHSVLFCTYIISCKHSTSSTSPSAKKYSKGLF